MSYLSQKGVSYTSKDVANDQDAFQEFLKLHSPGTPTIVIGDKVIIGFDRQKVDEALAS